MFTWEPSFVLIEKEIGCYWTKENRMIQSGEIISTTFKDWEFEQKFELDFHFWIQKWIKICVT